MSSSRTPTSDWSSNAVVQPHIGLGFLCLIREAERTADFQFFPEYESHDATFHRGILGVASSASSVLIETQSWMQVFGFTGMSPQSSQEHCGTSGKGDPGFKRKLQYGTHSFPDPSSGGTGCHSVGGENGGPSA
jgi:hypothetical protein